MPANGVVRVLTLDGHKASVSSVAFSPDGSTVASVGGHKLIKIWNYNTGQCIATLQGHEYVVHFVTYSRDGNMLATVSWDYTSKIWDVRSGDCIATFKDPKISCVAFSPDGTRVTTVNRAGNVKIWQIKTGECIVSLNTRDGSSVAYSPDGARIASGSHGNSIDIFDAKTSRFLTTFQGHSAPVRSVAYSPKGNRIASGSEDKTIKIWDTDIEQCIGTLQGHDGFIHCVVYSPDGANIASASADKTLKIWDAITGICIVTLQGHDASVLSLSYSPDGTKLVSGSEDMTLKVWDAFVGVSKTRASTPSDEAHSNDATTSSYVLAFNQTEALIECITYSPNRGCFACVSTSGLVNIWDEHTGQIGTTMETRGGDVQFLAFSPDASKLLTGNWYGASIRDVKSKERIAELEASDDRVYSVAYSPDGTRVATGGFKSVNVWDSSTGKLMGTLKGHESYVFAIAYSSDGSKLASGSEDNYAKVWDTHTRECGTTMIGHELALKCVAYSPDGGTIASGSEDTLVKIWDANFGNCIATLKGHSGSVHSVTYSADGAIIASGGADKSVKIWDSITGACLGGITLTSLLPFVALPADGLSIRFACKEHIQQASLASLRLSISNTAYSPLITRQDWLAAIQIILIHFSVNHETFKYLLDIADDMWLLVTPDIITAALSIGTRDPSLLRYTLLRIAHGLANTGRQCPTSIPKAGWFDLNPLIDLAMIPITDYYTEVNDFLKAAPLLQLPQPQYTSFDLHERDMAVLGSQLATTCAEVEQGVSKSASPSHVDHCIVPLSNTSGLFDSLVSSGNSDVFQGIIPRAILQFKWQAYGRHRHAWHLVIYLIGLLSLSALSLLTSGNAEKISAAATAMCVITALPSMYGVRREIYQLQLTGFAYFSRMWNLLDLTHHAFTITCIALYIAQSSTLQVVIAIALFLRWFGILYYLQPFDSTGALVRMILQIIVDIRWFLMILCIAILAGANAFYLLVRTDDYCARLVDDDGSCISPYTHPQDSVFAMFDMLIMGSFSGSDFDFGPYTALLKLMYALARVLVSVVLLNLLIALMNNSFSAISEQSDQEISMLRADIIVEQEQLMSENDRQDPRLFPKYIHVLVRSGQNIAAKDKASDSRVMDKLERMQTELQSVKSDIMRIEDHLKSLSDNQQAFFAQLRLTVAKPE